MENSKELEMENGAMSFIIGRMQYFFQPTTWDTGMMDRNHKDGRCKFQGISINVAIKQLDIVKKCLIKDQENEKNKIMRFFKCGIFMEGEGKKVKFLDAGCGVGFVNLLASYHGFDSYGIDIDYDYLKKARKLNHEFDYDKKHFLKRDILKFKDYSKFDVIYYFCPLFFNTEAQIKFERKVEKEMKKGAYLIANNKFGGEPSGFKLIDNIRDDDYCIYKKIK